MPEKFLLRCNKKEPEIILGLRFQDLVFCCFFGNLNNLTSSVVTACGAGVVRLDHFTAMRACREAGSREGAKPLGLAFVCARVGYSSFWSCHSLFPPLNLQRKFACTILSLFYYFCSINPSVNLLQKISEFRTAGRPSHLCTNME